MAFVAYLKQDDNIDEIIGIARYVSDLTGSISEFSISVSDQYSAHGVGINLMKHLIKYAKKNRIEKMIGYILSSNFKMLQMARKLGFQINSSTNEAEFKIAILELQK
jgi:L-amino acid N-acyltransferase YncA